MVAIFSFLSDICPEADCLIIRCRVLRLWYVRSTSDVVTPSSIEIVLVDEKGHRIHASVMEHEVELFIKKLVEGAVYEISSFSILSSVGSHRTTSHSCRIVFNANTVLQQSRLDTIPLYALALVKLDEISVGSFDFLFDVVAYATGITSQNAYFVDGKISKVALMELTDESGTADCFVVGDSSGPMEEYMCSGQSDYPVVVLRFVRITMLRGNAKIETVSNVTSILVNPDIPEVSSFRERMFGIGFISSVPVSVLDSTVKGSEERDFLRLYPFKTLLEFVDVVADGIFILCGTIVDFVEGKEWWSAACQCHRMLNRRYGSCYCDSCAHPVVGYQPEFSLNVRLSDGTGEILLCLSDSNVYYLIKKHCSEFVDISQDHGDLGFPPELLAIKGRKMAIKVEKRTSSLLSTNTVTVKRVCHSPDILMCLFAEKSVACVPENTEENGVLDVLYSDVDIVKVGDLLNA